MRKISSNVENIIKKAYKKSEFIKNPTGYFYDLNTIDENINNLKKYLPRQVDLYYAMKANNNKDVLKHISSNDYVCGIEIASYGELKQALKHRKGKEILFTGPGKTELELESAIKSSIKYINVESVIEAIRINNIAHKLNVKKVNILVRINTNHAISGKVEQMGGTSTKLGIDENECIASIKYIKTLSRINIKGIHVFAASGVLDDKKLIESNEYIFKLAKKVEKEVGHLSTIDFGGGLGIDYSDHNKIFNIEEYGKNLKALIDKYKFNHKEIIVELGTYLVGNAGYYTAKIIDIKKVKGKKHIIMAGGINHSGLQLEMRRMNPICIVKMNEPKIYEKQVKVSKEKVDVSGPLCLSADKLAWDVYIEEANIGDIVVFLQSGAYCYGEGLHEFLSHLYPNEFIISK